MSRNRHSVDEALNDPKLHFAKQLHQSKRERQSGWTVKFKLVKEGSKNIRSPERG